MSNFELLPPLKKISSTSLMSDVCERYELNFEAYLIRFTTWRRFYDSHAQVTEVEHPPPLTPQREQLVVAIAAALAVPQPQPSMYDADELLSLTASFTTTHWNTTPEAAQEFVFEVPSDPDALASLGQASEQLAALARPVPYPELLLTIVPLDRDMPDYDLTIYHCGTHTLRQLGFAQFQILDLLAPGFNQLSREEQHAYIGYRNVGEIIESIDIGDLPPQAALTFRRNGIKGFVPVPGWASNYFSVDGSAIEGLANYIIGVRVLDA